MPQRALVRKIEAITRLTGEERGALNALRFDERVVPRKRDLTSIGDKPAHVQVILDGWAARYSVTKDGARTITALLIPGDFGDIYVTSLDAMDHGIVALTDCHVALVETAAIEQLTRLTPTLTLAFRRATLIDEAILRQWIVNNNRKSALQRIAHFYCEVHARLGLIGLANAADFVSPLRQLDVADATGLTSVHVNRTLRELRERELMRVSGSAVQMLDLTALRRVAEFNPRYLHLRVDGT